MTRQRAASHLARCAVEARVHPTQVFHQPLLAPSAAGDHLDCAPSTSLDSGIPVGSPHGWVLRPWSLALRAFCSWPAAAASSGPAQAPAQSLQHSQLLLDREAAAEYERRLNEFLSASRTQREPVPGPAPHPPEPQPGLGALEPTGASTSASRATQQEALRPAPAFAPARSGGGGASCSTSSGGATAAVRLPSRSSSPSRGPAPSSPPASPSSLPPPSSSPSSSPSPSPSPSRPPPPPSPSPAPHPASPTPVDWRELLRRARREREQQQAGPLSGAQMLTDTFSRHHTYLRISLTERCNLRCTYCMPAEGVALTPGGQLLTTPEILRLARIFVEAGVTKIRLTGGEPTLRRDIGQLVAALSDLRPAGLSSLAITSNGLVLARQLPALKEAGLTAVNISLDTLRPERFEQLARRPGHGRVMEAIRTAAALGFDPVKINVVVMRGVNDDEVADFAALTAEQPLNVRFIEYMPFDGNVWSDSKMVPYRELLSRISSAFPHAPLERLDDPRGEVAKNFRLRGHRGSVSFITSMTQHFCSDCNRLRLLADGNLKVCLFGASEVSLRDALRGGASDEELRDVIGAAVGRKRAAHAGMAELAAQSNRPMITIGG